MSKEPRQAASTRAEQPRQSSPEPESHLLRQTLVSTVTLLAFMLVVFGAITWAQNAGVSGGWILVGLCMFGVTIGLLIALVLGIRTVRSTRSPDVDEHDDRS